MSSALPLQSSVSHCVRLAADQQCGDFEWGTGKSELAAVDRVVERSDAPELRVMLILPCFRVTIDRVVDSVFNSIVN